MDPRASYEVWNMKSVKLSILVISCALVMSNGVTLATASLPSASKVMAHHLEAVEKDDVDAIMADYANDAVVVLPEGLFIGRHAIRQFFQSLAAQHVDWKAAKVTQEVKAEDVVLQHNLTSGASEVFVIRQGRVVFQSYLPPA
jgi:ketosteroid isomerase-like protein